MNVGLKERRRKGVRYDRYGYFFVAPFLIIFAVFQFWPAVQTLWLSLCKNYIDSFSNSEVGPVYTGLQNYRELLYSRRGVFLQTEMVRSIGNTFCIWMIGFIPQLLMALLLAVWFTDTRVRLKRQGICKVLVFMPNIITATSVALLFSTLFSYPNGPVNQLLVQAGILENPYNYLNNKWSVRLLIAFINWWQWYGNTFIILHAGILGLNPSLFESARVDGASSGQIFRKITLPLLRPIMLYVLVSSLAGGVQMYDIPKLLTLYGNGEPDYTSRTIAMYIREIAFTGSYQLGKASAASMILFGLTVIISLVLFRVMRDNDQIKERKFARQMRRGGKSNGK